MQKVMYNGTLPGLQETHTTIVDGKEVRGTMIIGYNSVYYRDEIAVIPDHPALPKKEDIDKYIKGVSKGMIDMLHGIYPEKYSAQK